MAKKKGSKKKGGKKDAKKNEDKAVTPKFRVAFANVHRGKEVEYEDGSTSDPKFSLVMIFNEDQDLGKLEKLVKKAVHEKYPDKVPKNLKMPFRDGEEKEDLEGFGEGTIFAAASTFYRPGIVDRDREPLLDPEDFYSGCYARATVNVYYYDKKGNRGFAFGLQNLQKVKDGDRLSGRASAEDDFEEWDDDDDEF